MAEPDRLVFRDRHRAESFGTSAEKYDSARPSYPDELIVQVFTHERLLSVEDWLAEMQTHSPMAMLNQDIRHALLADLGSAMTDVAADGVRVAYETRVTSALRR